MSLTSVDKILGTPLSHKHKDSDISDFTVLDSRYVNVTGDTMTGLLTLPQLSVSGAVSAAAWGVTGIGLVALASTYTDSSSSGTVTSTAVHAIARPTVAASSATTYTNYATLHIAGQPIAGTNAIITNPFAIRVAAGNVWLQGGLILGGTLPGTIANGDLFSRGGMSIGNQSVDPLSQGVLDLVDSRSLAASVTSWRALRGISNVTPGVANITIRGLEFIARDNNSGSFNIATIEGINARGQLQNTSGITVSNMRGLSAVMVTPSTSTSTVSDARGIDVAVTHAGGTIANLYGIRINAPSGSGAVTTQYGLYIADIDTGSSAASAIVTNAGDVIINEGGDANTDVRIEGDTDANLFFTDASADFVGIGTASPVSKLDVSQSTGGILTLRRVDTSITANDVVGALQWYAADTSTTTTFVNAKIEVQATNTISTDINPTRMIFSTTPTGVAGVLTEALRITEAQYVVTAAELEVNGDFNHDGTNVGFYGVAPTTRPTAYTQNYTSTSRTVNAYTTDSESVAYTGIDNAQVGTPYAQVSDLNSLRTGYENLRASYDNLLNVVTQMVDDFQLNGLLQ